MIRKYIQSQVEEETGKEQLGFFESCMPFKACELIHDLSLN